jgi:hypothetical protein
VFGPERDVLNGNFDATRVYDSSTEDGRKGKALWTRASSTTGAEILETHPVYGFVTALGTIYALTYVESPKAQNAQLRVGSEAKWAGWLNGRQVRASERMDAAGTGLVDGETCAVSLKAGRNELLIRIGPLAEYTANASFVRLTDKQGAALPDITYSLPEVPPENRQESSFLKKSTPNV